MELLKKLKAVCGRAVTFIGTRPALLAVILSFFITAINEILSRRSFVSAVVFMFTKPLIFLTCFSMVLVFEALAIMAKRRKYVTLLVSSLWLFLGIVNFVLQTFRTLPFSFSDIAILPSVLPILEIYITPLGVIAVMAGIVLLLVLLIYKFFKAKKYPRCIKSGLVMLTAAVIGCISLITICKAVGIFPKKFAGLQTAYIDYGFNYCFVVSITDKGMNTPDDYHEGISQVVTEISENHEPPEYNPSPNEKKEPNVIFVQLESFYDLKKLNGFEFETDPCPNFTALRESFQSGYLTVPSIGTGTINTEFEVITGMSMQWFGAGEFPYETVLRDTTCESVCYNLAEHGYTSHAVHNYRATFYHRDEAFENLGFDTFTPIEYMNGYKSGWKGWASDDVLTKYISSALDSTEGSDLVYCISVQCHGIYPTDKYEMSEDSIKITKLPEEANPYSFSYYIDQLRQTDRFIGELISYVNSRDEDTVVVFFGDHIPNIQFSESWIPSDSTLYDTEYIIWSNCRPQKEDKNLKAYQLSTEIMSILGFDNGFVTKLHQMRGNMPEETYLKYLEMLQYDILYGYKVTYGGSLPFKRKDIKYGTADISVTDVKKTSNGFSVLGSNFTSRSFIYINGDKCDTEFISENEISTDEEIHPEDVITVVQLEATFSSVLSRSNTFIFKQFNQQ